MTPWPTPRFSIVLIVTSLWVIGTTLSLLAMTNGLTQSPFVQRNVLMWGIQVGAFTTWLAVLWTWLRGWAEARQI